MAIHSPTPHFLLLLLTSHLTYYTFCRFLLRLRILRQDAYAVEPSPVPGEPLLDDGDGRRGEVYQLRTALVS
jgi:hypothetical protein